MKNHLIALLVAAALTLPLSAQVFVGTDNFDTGSSTKWDYSGTLPSTTAGTLAFTNNRLDFSKTGSGAYSRNLYWDSNGVTDGNLATSSDASVTSASYTTSWSSTLTVTNTLSTPPSGQFATIGLSFQNDAGSYSALMLSSTDTGYFIRSEGTGFTAVNTSTADNTAVTLRLNWDASAKTLAAAYSTDGSNFTSVATFLPVSQWNNSSGSTSVTNGFNFSVFGNSDTTADIAVGSVFADNFTLTAVPEPSTYAAFAGLGALGLALWRRRTAKKSA